VLRKMRHADDEVGLRARRAARTGSGANGGNGAA
jgi:hypothetical protein